LSDYDRKFAGLKSRLFQKTNDKETIGFLFSTRRRRYDHATRPGKHTWRRISVRTRWRWLSNGWDATRTGFVRSRTTNGIVSVRASTSANRRPNCEQK